MKKLERGEVDIDIIYSIITNRRARHTPFSRAMPFYTMQPTPLKFNFPAPRRSIYLMIRVIRPVPTVLPPSAGQFVSSVAVGKGDSLGDLPRTLKRCPVSRARGFSIVHLISTLSPGMTIFESASSVPSGHIRVADSSAVRMKS
jgi:hypothetical protein